MFRTTAGEGTYAIEKLLENRGIFELSMPKLHMICGDFQYDAIIF